MDLTQGSKIEKNNRAKKMMLWFGMISLTMSFLGITSGYIVSKTRVDWVSDLELPTAFTASLIVIIFSSILLYLSKLSLKNNDFKKSVPFFFLVIVCAVTFVLLQGYGFYQLVESNNHFTGPTSNITSSFVSLIAFFILFKNFSGLLCLVVVFIKLLNKKYQTTIMAFELAANFWHFVDVLWIYLIFIFSFLHIN